MRIFDDLLLEHCGQKEKIHSKGSKAGKTSCLKLIECRVHFV